MRLGRFGLLGALAASVFVVAPAINPVSQGMDLTMPRLPKKAVKARKRMKAAEPMGGWPRSKNPPTKRKLKRNMNHVAKRVNRKHRRARAA